MGAKAVVRGEEVEKMNMSEWSDIRLEHEKTKDGGQGASTEGPYKRFVTGEWNGLAVEFEKLSEEFVRKHDLAVAELTEKQLAATFRQALECGEFTRLVRVTDGGQSVIYIPFDREQALEARVAELKQQVEALTRATDPPRTIAIDEGTKI
jgi:hypothetical protein